MQGNILICCGHTVKLISFCLLQAHFPYWRHFISSCKPMDFSQSSIEPYRRIFISVESLFLNMLFWVKIHTFLLKDTWESWEISEVQRKPQIKIKPRTLSVNATMNGGGGVLGAWGHPWPNLILETPHTPLPTAMGLFSDTSLAGQGSLIEPFGLLWFWLFNIVFYFDILKIDVLTWQIRKIPARKKCSFKK